MPMLPAPADHPALALLPEVPTREDIERFEDLLFARAAEHGEASFGTEHYHAEGLYGRSIVIKAGTVLVGAAHKFEHLNISVGDITVWTEGGMKRLTGTNVLRSLPGAKRVGFAHADTFWLTVHANTFGTVDVAELENALTEDPSRLVTRRPAIEGRVLKEIA